MLGGILIHVILSHKEVVQHSSDFVLSRTFSKRSHIFAGFLRIPASTYIAQHCSPRPLLARRAVRCADQTRRRARSSAMCILKLAFRCDTRLESSGPSSTILCVLRAASPTGFTLGGRSPSMAPERPVRTSPLRARSPRRML